MFLPAFMLRSEFYFGEKSKISYKSGPKEPSYFLEKTLLRPKIGS